MIALLLALACGRDDWAIKTLTDVHARAALRPPPQASSIAALGSVASADAERRAFVVDGEVTVLKREADGDVHLVLVDVDLGAQMVVEAPDPECAKGSRALAAIVRARRQALAVRVGQCVRATGMLYVDRLHGQSGAAPNGAELHPLFRLQVIPCRPR